MSGIEVGLLVAGSGSGSGSLQLGASLLPAICPQIRLQGLHNARVARPPPNQV